LSLSLLIATDLKVFASLDGQLFPILAFGTLHSQDNLLSSLSLLSEDGFGLTAESSLFSVVSPSSLRVNGFFSLLILSDFVYGMFTTLALAISAPSLGHVDHFDDGVLLN